MATYCNVCGKEIPAGAAFCEGCGATVNAARQPAAPYAVPPQNAAPYQDQNPQAENPFRQFSREMNREAPAARSKMPGVVLSVAAVAAVAAVIVIAVFFLNRGVQVPMDDITGTWQTAIDDAAGVNQPGTMTLSLDYWGEGTASFAAHPELTGQLRAVYKDGALTLTGENISMSGRVTRAGETLELDGSFDILGRKGKWNATHN